ncbi:uncharacterized protein V6R79_016426 [Siganus canaliculatus]
MSQSVSSVSKPVSETKVSPEVEQLRKDMNVMRAEMLNLKATTVASQSDTQSPQAEIPVQPKYKKNATPQRAVFRKVFDELSEIPPDDDTHKRGTVWFTQNKPVTLRPGGVARVTGVPKFQGMPSTQAILVDSPDEPADELRFPEQLMVSRRVLRRRRKKQNTEKTQEIDKESETVENRLDATARTDDTDSESEEHGMWFDLFVEPPRIKMDEKVSEPFSLDLDVLASDQTGQPEEVEPEAIQEGEGNDVGCEETVNDTETQETSQTENQIQGHETADADTLSQEDTVTDTDNNTVTKRTQRVRRPPLKLTYDVPGQPSVKMAPSVKYVSCLYKWIGVPMETSFVGFFSDLPEPGHLSAFGRWCLLDWCLLDWCTELSGGGRDMDWEEENASEATIAKREDSSPAALLTIFSKMLYSCQTFNHKLNRSVKQNFAAVPKTIQFSSPLCEYPKTISATATNWSKSKRTHINTNQVKWPQCLDKKPCCNCGQRARIFSQSRIRVPLSKTKLCSPRFFTTLDVKSQDKQQEQEKQQEQQQKCSVSEYPLPPLHLSEHKRLIGVVVNIVIEMIAFYEELPARFHYLLVIIFEKPAPVAHSEAESLHVD